MSRPPSDTFPEKICNLLQQSWDSEATGLQVTDITWTHDRYETMVNVEQQILKAIISTYNPPNPVTSEVLSAQTNFVHETVVIDVILHPVVLGGTDNCIATRAAIKKLIFAIFHSIEQQTWLSLAGADSVWIPGEYACIEAPETQREAFKVVVDYFEVLPS